MRTNYPLDKIVRRKDEEKRRLIIALVILAVVALLLIMSSSVRVGLSKLAVTITRPLWVVENNSLVLGGDLFSFLRSHKGLVEENRQLHEKIFQLQSMLASQQLIVSDYDRLSLLFGRVSGKTLPVLGKVIVKPGRSPYDLVVIDVGTSSPRSVKIGDVAKLNGSLTLGKVVLVTDTTATIKLFSSPGVTTQVLVGVNRLPATVTGRGGGNMLLVLPKGLEVQVGDQVVLPTDSFNLIGTVSATISDQNDPAQKMIVSLPVNIFNLSWIELYGS